MLIDELARRQGTRADRLQHSAAVGRAQLEGRRLLLAKPLTFMNSSGESVGKLARYYKVRQQGAVCGPRLHRATRHPASRPAKSFSTQGTAGGVGPPDAARLRCQVPLERVLVVYDDLDLENGAVRLRARGGHGGHNGMRSVTQHFSGSKDFPRLRIGAAAGQATARAAHAQVCWVAALRLMHRMA